MNQDIHIIKIPFELAALSREVPKIAENTFPEHDSIFIYEISKMVVVPVVLAHRIDFEDFLSEELLKRDLELLLATEEPIAGVALLIVCDWCGHIREEASFVEQSCEATGPLIHEVLEGCQNLKRIDLLL